MSAILLTLGACAAVPRGGGPAGMPRLADVETYVRENWPRFRRDFNAGRRSVDSPSAFVSLSRLYCRRSYGAADCNFIAEAVLPDGTRARRRLWVLLDRHDGRLVEPIIT